MTVASGAYKGTAAWTGVETSFNPAFSAQDIAHVVVTYTKDGITSTLTHGVHLTLSKAGAAGENGAITAVPIGGSMPAASGTLTFTRVTPDTQGTDFDNLSGFSAQTHEDKHDRHTNRDAELAGRIATIEATDPGGAAAAAAASAAAAAASAAAAATAETNAETAEANAETAEVNAEAAATAAAASAALAAANSENPAFSYKWHTNTGASDPGATYVKGNNAALGSITALRISETALEGPIGGFITAMMSSASPIKATVVLMELADPNNWVALDVTAHSDDGAYRTLTCTNIGSGGSFNLDEEVGFYVTRSGPPGSGLADVVDDTTPQLGGQLDVNGFALGDGTRELLKFEETGSAVNELSVVNAATGNAPQLKATGDDANIDLQLTPKGTGIGKIGSNRIAAVAAPGADRVLIWDHSALDYVAATLKGPIEINGTELRVSETFGIALSDETTAITTGANKATMSLPFAFTVTSVYATLNTVSSSGIPTVDINEGGTTILSTKLTIDVSEKTSATAAAAAVISDAAIAANAEIGFDIDVAGTGAKGLKVFITGYRT